MTQAAVDGQGGHGPFRKVQPLSERRAWHLPALDGFRAYAILGVISLHVLASTGALEGAEGSARALVVWGLLGNVIDAFFIISGFVLFLPIAVRGQMGSLRDFAIGRAVRLLPAYWLCLVICALLLALAPPSPTLGAPGARDLLIHATALQMPARLIDPQIAHGFGLNGALWMFSVIVGFYVVLPLIARFYLRHPLVGLVIAAAITLGWRHAALHSDGLLRAIEGGSAFPSWALELIALDQFPGWAFSFALGMTGAWGYVQLKRRDLLARAAPRAALAMPVALAACLLFAYFYGREAAEINGAVAGSAARSSSLLALGYSLARAALMASIAIGPAWVQRPFANRPIARVAALSYGLYLIHLVVATYVGLLLLELPSDGSAFAIVAWFTVVLAVSAIYAQLSLRFVERPAKRLPELIGHSGRGLHAALNRRRRPEASLGLGPPAP